MPRKDYDLEATWNEDWILFPELHLGGKRGGRKTVVLHYSRAGAYIHYQKTAAGIADALGWTAPGPTILVFGSGFGWLAEALEDLGFTSVAAADVSSWIQVAKDEDEVDDIDAAISATGLDPASGEGAMVKAKIRALGKGPGARCRASRGVLAEDGKTGGSRGRIKQALGLSGNDKIDWALTDDLARTLDDSEAVDIASRIDSICTNSAHYTSVDKNDPRQDAALNWHTLEDWKALVPDHTWIEAGTFRIL